MTYSQLKAFHALAQERNFHRAAEKLFLTQPAVSIQIRNLEQHSARILFRRSGHSVDLTEDGLALFELTCQMFEVESRVQRLFTAPDERLSRTIHLGADGPHVALDLIEAVTRCTPDIHFRVTLANADTTKENLLALKIDAAVMAYTKVDSRFIAKTISKQDLMALIPTGHALSEHKSVTIEELAPHPLVFREPGSNTQRIVNEAFSSSDFHINTALVMGSREGVKEAVARGLGIGFVFDRELPQDSRCVGVKVKGFESSNADMLLCLKDQHKNPVVKALFDAANSDDF
ncbi:MAG: LysR substrate-binding domain-containing protein [Pseudomonadales bacterium]|nr:LysR substrate-binding domain-containing protein [Pseudomonadales bacterium]NRA14597.1 LysR family transcriptional regulator [Oceanospirillaceae bacterium]